MACQSLSLVSLHMAESLMTMAYFPGIQILDVGGFWSLFSNLAAPGWLPAYCALGAARCVRVSGAACLRFPQEDSGRDSQLLSLLWKTDSRNLFQILASLSLISLCKTPLPGSGEGTADIRNKQYFSFFRIKMTFLG